MTKKEALKPLKMDKQAQFHMVQALLFIAVEEYPFKDILQALEAACIRCRNMSPDPTQAKLWAERADHIRRLKEAPNPMSAK